MPPEEHTHPQGAVRVSVIIEFIERVASWCWSMHNFGLVERHNMGPFVVHRNYVISCDGAKVPSWGSDF